MDANLHNQVPSNRELLEAIRKGSKEAADIFYSRQDSSLLNVVISFLRGRGCNQPYQHAEAVKNGAWSNIIRSINKLKDADKFNAWRDTIARNEANEHLKICIREQNTSVELEDETLLPEAQISDYYKSKDAAIDADKMLTLAESISPEFGLLFRLHNVDELGFDEIAVQLGKNKEAVRTAYGRGFKRLIAKVRRRGG